MEDKYSEILKPLWKKRKTDRKKNKEKRNIQHTIKMSLKVNYFWKVTAQGSLSRLVCAKHFFFFFFFLIVDFNFLFHKLQNNNPVISFNALFQKYCIPHKEEISMFEYFTSKNRAVTFRWISKMNYEFITDILHSL